MMKILVLIAINGNAFYLVIITEGAACVFNIVSTSQLLNKKAIIKGSEFFVKVVAFLHFLMGNMNLFYNCF